MLCPKDGAPMEPVTRHGVTLDHCPACGGVWLDRGELEHLLEVVRPAVELGNPDGPEPVAAPPAPPVPPAARPAKAAKPERRVETASRARSAPKAKSSRPKRKPRLRDILEEIFDFD